MPTGGRATQSGGAREQGPWYRLRYLLWGIPLLVALGLSIALWPGPEPEPPSPSAAHVQEASAGDVVEGLTSPDAESGERAVSEEMEPSGDSEATGQTGSQGAQATPRTSEPAVPAPQGDEPRTPEPEPAPGPVPEPEPDPDPEPDPTYDPAGMPGHLAVISGQMADELEWEPPTEGSALSYMVRVGARPDGPWTQTAAGLTQTTYASQIASPGVRYYAVSAVGEGGDESPWTASVANDHVSMNSEVSPAGGVLRSSNGEVELALAAGAFATTTTVLVEENEWTSLPRGLLPVAGVYDLQPSGSLGATATLRVRCEPEVGHFQIAATLMAGADLMTRDEGSGSWIVGSPDGRLEGPWLVGTLDHFSYWSGATIQPHGTTSPKTDYCDGICHNLTPAPGAPDVIPNRDPSVCFFCHGNSDSTDPPAGASGPNIEAAFLNCDDQTFNPANNSRHPAATSTTDWIGCADCHDPHRDPGAEPGLLRTYDAVTGRSVRSGDDFCFACHGKVKNRRINRAVPGYYSRTAGDKKSGYAGSVHETAAPTASGITCSNCHDSHGAQEVNLGMTGEEQSCYMCHGTGATDAPDIQSVAELVPSPQPDWVTTVVFDTTRIVYDVVVGDMDGDGDFDLVSGDRLGDVVFSENTSGDGTAWSNTIIYNGSSRIRAVAIGDIDDDDDLDIACGREINLETIMWLENAAGDGSAWTARYMGLGTGIGTRGADIAIGDLDGDGDGDIVHGNWDDRVWRSINTNGSGTSWAHASLYVAGGDVTAVSLGHLDDDGDLDIASGSADGFVRWHENADGAGTSWNTNTILNTGSAVQAVEIGDVDDDTDPDVVSGGSSASSLYFHENTAGDASAWSPVLVGGAAVRENIALGDIDGDGDLDIADSADGHDWFENSASDGSAWIRWDSDLPGGYGADTGDIDGDGNTDLVSSSGIGNDDGKSYWHENRVVYPQAGVHPIGTYSGRHETAEGTSALGVGNRHVECVDCHNVHTARRGTHESGEATAGGALYGSVGVVVTDWPTGFLPPTAFSREVLDGDVTDFEALLCFKCHSGYTSLPTGGGSGGYGSTDVAREFNPNNDSGHNVLGDVWPKTSFVPAGVTRTWAFPATNVFAAGWSVSSSVACSDCHTYDSGDGSAPAGPHGSSAWFLIDSAYPTPYGSARLNATSPTGMSTELNIGPAGVICEKCHDLHDGTNFGNNAHRGDGAHPGNPWGRCVNCHVSVPHGWKRPRLLAYTSDPEPYTSGGLVAIREKSYTPMTWPTMWLIDDCTTTGCGSKHNPAVSPAWP